MNEGFELTISLNWGAQTSLKYNLDVNPCMYFHII